MKIPACMNIIVNPHFPLSPFKSPFHHHYVRYRSIERSCQKRPQWGLHLRSTNVKHSPWPTYGEWDGWPFVSGRIVRCSRWWRRDCGCDDKSISHWSGKLGDSRDSLTEVVQIWRLRLLRAWVFEATCATEPYQYLLWHVEPVGQHIPSFQG